jgi:CBS domain-containing protein
MQTTLRSILETKGNTVHTVLATSTVLDAVRAMNEVRVGSVLVMDGDDLVGIFTERDVLTRVLDGGVDPATTPVSEVMTSEVVTVGPQLTVEEAMAVVTQERCRHLPVMEDNKLLGLVSAGDLTRRVAGLQEQHIEHLVKYITSQYPA